MIYKSFRVNCICRIVLLTTSLCILFYLFFQTRFFATCGILGALIIFQILSLLNYIDKSNQLLSQTFASILHEDFSERLNIRRHDSSFQEICLGLNQIIDKFQNIRLEKEQQFQYLQSVIEQTGIGLISVKANKEVNLINKSARNMLQLPNITHLDQLESTEQRLSELLEQMKSGEKRYFDNGVRPPPVQMSVYAKEMRVQGEKYRLFTLQNIQNELEEKEMDAWKNLIRVLSHEIMNSITPISSLAATANQLIGNSREILPADINDIRQAVQTIEKRSLGLMQFVQNYRKFAKIPEPQLEIVSVKSLFKRIDNLILPSLKKGSIRLHTSIKPKNLQLKIDPDLIEQVLLNLLANSIEALQKSSNPEIRMEAERDDKSVVVIRVEDNGKGIPEDVVPKIFIPFFTTRSKGSGIGLSLSRQIMRLHGGSIRVRSEPEIRTVFFLTF